MSRDSGRRAGAGRRPGQGRPSAGLPARRGQGGQAQDGQARGSRSAGAGPRDGQPHRGRGQGGDPARRAAWDVLAAVTSRDAYANLLLAASLRERGLHGKDAALATELVYGTLRNRSCYDAVIAACADREVAAIDPPLLEVLRLGAHQLLGMRVRPHAAVATAVDLAVDVAGRRPSGFVNAVLRRVALRDLGSWIELVAPDRAADPAGYLSVRYSHPRWIVAALAAALGEDAGGDLTQTEAALAADQERPAVTLAAVPGLARAGDLVAAGAEPARWSPFGAYLPHGDPGAVAAVADGRAGVQDEASQLAVLALTRAAAGGPDRYWLDMCAGPGGKARLLAGIAAGRGARLAAADAREHRARLVARALAPVPDSGSPGVGGSGSRGAGSPGSGSPGVGSRGSGTRASGSRGDAGPARALAADGTRPPWRSAAFDRVLADVPCSGLGSLRRRPEARWRRSPDELGRLGVTQRALLAAAIEAARPGGVIGYVTCSPLLVETRDVVRDVLASRGGAEVLDAPALLPEVPGLACRAPDSSFAQFWPHRHGTDAIFIALLRRTG